MKTVFRATIASCLIAFYPSKFRSHLFLYVTHSKSSARNASNSVMVVTLLALENRHELESEDETEVLLSILYHHMPIWDKNIVQCFAWKRCLLPRFDTENIPQHASCRSVHVTVMSTFETFFYSFGGYLYGLWLLEICSSNDLPHNNCATNTHRTFWISSPIKPLLLVSF